MLKLALIDELRQDFCMTEPNYILVRLTDNDHFVADVRVLFQYEDRYTQAIIEELSDDYANLSCIFAPEQIIVIVLMTILHYFTDEHEFYDQIFYRSSADYDESIRLDAINPFAR